MAFVGLEKNFDLMETDALLEALSEKQQKIHMVSAPNISSQMIESHLARKLGGKGHLVVQN